MAKKNKNTASEPNPAQQAAPKSSAQGRQNLASGWSFWKEHVIASIIIVVASMSLYLGTTSYDYILDDQIVITDNVYTNQGFAGIKNILFQESFMGYFQKKEDLVAGSRYRPLSIVTFAIEREFFEKEKSDGYGNILKDGSGKPLVSGDPAVAHFINLVLYALTGLLLFRILFMLFPSAAVQGKWYLGVPFAATLLFMVHPLHVEVVANVKGRDEIMTLLFSLLALYYTIRYAREEKTRQLILASLMYFLGLLSKENALTFVAIIPMTLYFFTKAKRSTLVVTSVPLLITTFFYLMLRYQVIGYFFSGKEITDIMNNPFYGMTFAEKYATITYTLGLYLKLCFLPNPLTHDYYPYAIAKGMSFTDVPVLASLASYLGLMVMAVIGWKSKNVLSYCVLLFVFALSIVSNLLLPIGSFMNERFAYISSIGFCVAIAYILLEYLPTKLPSLQKFLLPVGMLLIILSSCAYGAITFNRVPAFKDHFALNDADIETSASSCRANCFMGVGLYQRYLKEKDSVTKRKMIFDAGMYLKKSLDIYPAYFGAMQMWSGVLAHQFKYDRDTKKMLDGFYYILERTDKIDYVEKYLVYMNAEHAPIYKDILVPFYHRLSYDLYFKTKNDRERARRYAQLGLEWDPNNAQLKADMNEYGGTVRF